MGQLDPFHRLAVLVRAYGLAASDHPEFVDAIVESAWDSCDHGLARIVRQWLGSIGGVEMVVWARQWVSVLAVVVLGLVGVGLVGGASRAWATGSASFFSALPASGATEMVGERAGAVSAALPDGRVLIAGGSLSKTAEVFSPASDSFTLLPAAGDTELQTARSSAVAAPLPSGQVLIAGGTDGTSILQSAELFDPATDSFTALPASGATELQTPRLSAVAAPLPDGQVLIAGGSPNGGNATLQSAELFDPSTDSFTALPASGSTELQTPRQGAVAAPLPNGEVLIAGGFNAGGVLQSAEVFDPATDSFTALPASGSTELQTPRFAALAASLPNGEVLIAGGSPDHVNILQSAELFDPATDSFTALPASGDTELQTARALAFAAPLPNAQLLIAGGTNSSGDLRSAELFVSAPQAAAAGGTFGTQTVGAPSAAQPLVVTNVGAQALKISAASLDSTGDPGDFTITADECAGRTLAFEQACTITARFTPSVSGARAASVVLTDNEPTAATIALSGTGVAANSGPTGATGPTGPASPPGATGAPGKPGSIELVTCTTVTKTVRRHGKKHKLSQKKCTTKTISGTATFTTTRALATLTRRRVLYATGSAYLARLVLHARRPIPRGRYTLTLTTQQGHRKRTIRQPIGIS